ncbi:hypothetical protein D3C81_792960 [compost metagenome]
MAVAPTANGLPYVPLGPTNDQSAPFALPATKVSSGGSASSTMKPVAMLGPLLVTVMV